LPHDASLIAIVAVGFVLASIFGYLADRLRLPALVGYLVAGVFVGPFTPGFVADVSMASQLAEIGVILLMFGVGLHFSLPDLMAVRGIAVPGAIGRIVLATLLGMALGSLWGWSVGQGLVFGLCISVASTVVTLKALEERNLLETPMGRVSIGWLIVEDLAMVLVLVLLPALAEVLGGSAGDAAHGAAADTSIAWTLALTLLQVGAFVAIAALVGPRVVPWVLIKVARTGSRELFTLAVLALALGIAFGSALAFGVSFALGAFFAGVVMAESQLAHRAAENSLPLQDAFSVLFFVSIGMLFDPSILVREPGKVLAVLAVIIIGKALLSFLLVVALRYPLRIALGVAASLAQIGEFSFILAGLGATYGLMSQEGRDLILAGAILSIMLNPIAFQVTLLLKTWMQKRWPQAMAEFGAARQAALVGELDRIRTLSRQREHEQEQKITEFVETFPLFSAVDSNAHEEILLLFGPRTASPGERIIRTGDRGDAMYFVVSGTVEVQVNGRKVALLEAGAYFGEMALLTGGRRTADVTAVDYCQLLVLTRRDFNVFMSHHPELRQAMNEMAEKRRAMNERETAASSELRSGV
jgi:CPA2 family monovalent cation:H+ antiporter-2